MSISFCGGDEERGSDRRVEGWVAGCALQERKKGLYAALLCAVHCYCVPYYF